MQPLGPDLRSFVGAGLDHHARLRPDETALVLGSRSWSRRSLFLEVSAFSDHLGENHVPGALIGVALADPADALIAFFACARARCVAVLINPDWPQAQYRAVLENIDLALVIDAPVWRMPGFKSASGVALSGTPAPNDLFYAGFTSGSTGVPKGYIRDHKSWTASFALSDAVFGIGPGDTVFIAGSLHHSLHLYGAVQALEAGAALALHDAFRPRQLAEDMTRAAAAVYYATPTQLHYLAKTLERMSDPRPPRLIMASGAKWDDADRAALQELIPDTRFAEFYGASETSFVAIATFDGAVPEGSVGKPAPGVAVSIRDADGHPVPAGTPGRILVKSDLLFSGYICGAGAAEWRDGWLSVGDRGVLDPDGFLFVEGRENRMMLSAGLNIYPEEIERCLARHPAVEHVAVFGVADPVRGARPVAALLLRAPVDIPDLQVFCAERIGRAKVPSHFVVREEWPLTPGGKTDLKRIEHELIATLSSRGAA
ncbi:class I adenylate-forming enzyme family protein [Roseibium sp. RKSG952]|uniref:class I adenylate-forming enzyme family protein n=1 Tax=Roseibium sp. RKSG952 TaxID=2529384 RepID=UPI0012BC5821|nr:AMP-binding protein [Roseibium sp. RKSG952]MTH98826.1 AMP-dependent synthetase [Roseibium sp. RKSG952]